MRLSVIIVNYNTKELLLKCLQSLKFEIQNLKFETEIIVVDNGSKDGTVEVLRNFKSQDLKFKFKLIENKENLGFAKAVNQGIRQSHGSAIMLLNSDTVVKRGAIEKLIEFEKKVRPAIIGAKMLNPDGSIQGSCFHLPTICRAIKEYWFGKVGYFSKYVPEGNDAVKVEAVSGGAMLISKRIIENIGLFDERYFMYFEDLDYCRRARKAGFNIYYLPNAEIIHEHGASGRGLADEENQWRRLIPSSKIYHGVLKHWIMTFIIKTGNFLWPKPRKYF